MNLSESQWQYLRNFFEDRDGNAEGFLFKAFFDHSISHEDAAIAGSGLKIYGQLLPITATTFQIARVYELDGVKTYKPIRKPIGGTVRLFDEDKEEILKGWTANTATGIVTFSVAPVGIVRASCNFYYPMRLDGDRLAYVRQTGSSGAEYRIEPLRLKEVIIPLNTNFYTSNDFSAICQNFSPSFLPENEVSNKVFENTIDTTIAEVENATIYQNKEIDVYIHDNNSIDLNAYPSELDYVLGFFNVAKGQLLQHGDRRFDQDEITVVQKNTQVVSLGEIRLKEASGALSCPANGGTILKPRYYHIYGNYTSKLNGNCNQLVTWQTSNKVEVQPWESLDIGNINFTPNDLNYWNITVNGQDMAIYLTGFPGAEEKDGQQWWAAANPTTLPISVAPNGSDCIHGNALPYGNAPYVTDAVEVTVVDANNPLTPNRLGGDRGGFPYPFATFVKIVCRDDEVMGFTSWDTTLEIDGVVYKASTAINPSAFEGKADLSADNLEIASFLSDEDISELDILSGKFNDARVTISLINVVNYDLRHILVDGWIGEVRSTDSNFTFEIRSKTSRLDQASIHKTMTRCTYKFCDVGDTRQRCKLDIGDYTSDTFTVHALGNSINSSGRFFVTPAFPPPDGTVSPHNVIVTLYNSGFVRFKSGNLKNATFDIQSMNNAFVGGTLTTQVVLVGLLPKGLFAGDTLEFVQGCEKTPKACQEYKNYINFGGFPSGNNWMPGPGVFTTVNPR
jgi:uncharacterized phage protein (TIGR02218 family)/uncharacterized protein (TIGR02217 family)